MEVVLTSNLLSSETEKTTTASSFQIMAINSFVMPKAVNECPSKH